METDEKLWVIIKSGKKNWSGKEFSDNPAKVYSDFDDAVSALNSYHFYRFDSEKIEYIPVQKKDRIEIIHLTDDERDRLIAAGKARM
ncbi:MAG TPA: hypothetical protein VFG54_12285 [Prolixibacteraceae bacterium]|nr:hypothetical protein [Prolixibacteraceae bacterium]